MESVSKNTIFGLKMIGKSGLEKFILKSLHVGRLLYRLYLFRILVQYETILLGHKDLFRVTKVVADHGFEFSG